MAEVEGMSPEEYEREKARIIDALVKYVEVECGPEEFRRKIEENFMKIVGGYKDSALSRTDYLFGQSLCLDISAYDIRKIKPELFIFLGDIRYLRIQNYLPLETNLEEYEQKFQMDTNTLENCSNLEQLDLYEIEIHERDLLRHNRSLKWLSIYYEQEFEQRNEPVRFSNLPLIINHLKNLRILEYTNIVIEKVVQEDFRGLYRLVDITGDAIIEAIEGNVFANLTALRRISIYLPLHPTIEKSNWLSCVETLYFRIEDPSRQLIDLEKLLSFQNLGWVQISIPSLDDVKFELKRLKLLKRLATSNVKFMFYHRNGMTEI